MLLSQHDHAKYITQIGQQRADKIHAAAQQIAQTSSFLTRLQNIDSALQKLKADHIDVLEALKQTGYSSKALIQRNSQITQQLAMIETELQIELISRQQVLADATSAIREVLKDELFHKTSNANTEKKSADLQDLQQNITNANIQEDAICEAVTFTSPEAKQLDNLLQKSVQSHYITRNDNTEFVKQNVLLTELESLSSQILNQGKIIITQEQEQKAHVPIKPALAVFIGTIYSVVSYWSDQGGTSVLMDSSGNSKVKSCLQVMCYFGLFWVMLLCNINIERRRRTMEICC